MESTGEAEAVSAYDEIDIKEEPISTEPELQPFEQIFIKEENIECLLEEETTSPHDATYMKKESELQNDVESTSYGSEPESNIPVGKEDDKETDGSGSLASGGGVSTGPSNTKQCSPNQVAFCERDRGTLQSVHNLATGRETTAQSLGLTEDKEFPYSCSVCHKTFVSRGGWKIHLRRHTGERPYSCDVCHETFPSNTHLKNHLRQHTGDGPYICEVCHKVLSCESSLKIHSRVHTGERPYVCKVCQKTFVSSTNLKKHSRVHTGEHPYTCEVCHKAFICGSNLRRHSRVHSGERPYICEICHKTFNQSSSLKTHSRVHSC
ncbi:zinc finger protein 571-like isoform X2 [Schistocerca serialis cubense]|uniref:zinc finger protein 571-like isoform X2 n=1 Tax=Schistocerca serialis cubense TaxID=2023355 RepID=UPI00214EFA45|nr:zinc finger protein 571-like isoform X2 [Schistocerca serialis cubense]